MKIGFIHNYYFNYKFTIINFNNTYIIFDIQEMTDTPMNLRVGDEITLDDLRPKH
jgi:hypothetical protein